MRLPGVKTLRTVSRWMQARLLGGALILGYHRISAPPEAFPEMFVSPERFGEHLQVLCKYTHPVSLARLVQHLRDGSLPAKSVAITFDDGYVDNLHSAKPLLQKYEVPATVFVCTGYAGKEFWWDEVERLVDCSRNHLLSLHLQFAGKQFPTKLTKPWSKADESKVRDEFRRRLYHFLLALDSDDRNHALDTIRSWSDAPSDAASPSRAMSFEEMMQLADGELIELGAHTRNHPMLPRLSPGSQRAEIESNKRDLERLLGKTVSGFAYPNGGVTESTKRIVRQLGFAYACTSLHDVVRPGSDLYQLTRFWQQDVDGNAFLRGLHSWLRM